jgi:hypothetical protein
VSPAARARARSATTLVDEAHAQAGLIAVQLALRFPEWILRRVEQAVYLDDTTVRWRVSATFRLPEADFFNITTPLTSGQKIYLPLSLLKKRPLTQFDARDEDERPLPVLTTAQNSTLSESGMTAIIWSLAESLGRSGLDDRTVKTIRAVVSAPPVRALSILKDTLKGGELAEVLAQDEVLTALTQEFATSFMLLVPARYEPGRERVVKYAYTSPLPWSWLWPPRNFFALFGWADFRSSLEALALGASGSYHVEVEAPPDVRLASAALTGDYQDRERSYRVPVLLDRDGDNPRVNLHAVRPSAVGLAYEKERAAYKKLPFIRRLCTQKPERTAEPSDPLDAAEAIRPSAVERDDRGFATVWFRNEVPGTFMAAVVVSIVTCLTLWGARTRLAELDGEAAAAILLALPVLVASYLIRPGEHAFATRLLLGVRLLALLVGICALLVAGLLAGGVVKHSATTFPTYRCHRVGASARSGARTGAQPQSFSCAVTATHPAPEQLKPHVQDLANWAAYAATGATLILLFGLARTWFSPCNTRPDEA